MISRRRRLHILLLRESEVNQNRAFRFIAICESWSGEDFSEEKAKIESSLFSGLDLDELIVKMTNKLQFQSEIFINYFFFGVEK